MRFIKKIAGRGSLSLPSDLRTALDIEDGDIVEFAIVGVIRRADGRPDRSATGKQTPTGVPA